MSQILLQDLTFPAFGPLPGYDPVLFLEVGGIRCVLDYQTLNDVIKEQITPDGPTAAVKFKCLWRDRERLVRGLMGWNYLKNQTTITRELPATYPSNHNLFCTSITNIEGIKPYRDDSGLFSGPPDWDNTGDVQAFPGWTAYEYAVVTAVFSKPTYQIAVDDSLEDNDLSNKAFITTTIQPSGEILTPPGGCYYFVEGDQSGQPIQNSNVGLIYSRYEITMRRHFMPIIPLWDIEACLGHANLNPFVLTTVSFPPGNVLFMGTHTELRADPATGVPLWDIEYKFLANGQNSWNQLLDNKGVFSIISATLTAPFKPPFPPCDMDRLLSDTIATGPDPDPGPAPV